MHWISAKHAIKAEARLYSNLFKVENPAKGDLIENLNPHSLEVIDCFIEPELAKAEVGSVYQFERMGYFCVDPDSDDKKVFNRTVTLRDGWVKAQKNG